MYSPGASRTLHALTSLLPDQARGSGRGLCRPRPSDALHVTFRARGGRRRDWPAQLPALARLEWEVAVVQDHNPADPRHRDMRIEDCERFLLRRAL